MRMCSALFHDSSDVAAVESIWNFCWEEHVLIHRCVTVSCEVMDFRDWWQTKSLFMLKTETLVIYTRL